MEFNPGSLAPQQDPEQIRGRGGFLTSLISEGGAAGGAALGTSIAPGVGTVLGAALGGLFGRIGENKVRDDQFNIGSAIGEGLLSGATAGIAPAFRGAKALKAARGTSDDLIGAFSRGFSTPPSGGVLAGKLSQASDDSAIKSFKFTPSQLSKIKKDTGVDAAKIVKSEKLIGKSPEQIDEIIKSLDDEFGARVADVSVNRELLSKQLEKQYKPLINSVNQADQRLGQAVKAQADEIIERFDEIADGATLNSVKSGFASRANFSNAIANPDEANLSKRISDALRETLRESSGDDTLKTLGRRIQRIRKVNEAAALQANRGRGAQFVGLTDLLAGGSGAAAGGPVGALGAVAAKRVANSPTAQSAFSNTLGSASNAFSKIPASGFTGNLAGQLAARAPGAIGFQPQESSFDANQSTNIANSINSIEGTIPQATSNLQAQVEILKAQTLLDALSAGASPEDLEQIAIIMDLTLQSAGIPAAQAPPEVEMGAEEQKRALTAQSGLDSLSVLEETLATDPGAFQRQALPNPFGITGRLTDTADIRAATDNVVDVIARLRSGAAITEDEARRFATRLPLPGDSVDVAARKIAGVRAELESFINPDLSLTQALGAL